MLCCYTTVTHLSVDWRRNGIKLLCKEGIDLPQSLTCNLQPTSYSCIIRMCRRLTSTCITDLLCVYRPKSLGPEQLQYVDPQTFVDEGRGEGWQQTFYGCNGPWKYRTAPIWFSECKLIRVSCKHCQHDVCILVTTTILQDQKHAWNENISVHLFVCRHGVYIHTASLKTNPSATNTDVIVVTCLCVCICNG